MLLTSVMNKPADTGKSGGPAIDDVRDGVRWDLAEEGAELLREGSQDEACTHLENVLREDSENAYAAFRLGEVHFSGERWEKALKAFTTAIELSPDYTGALLGAGHTLRIMRRLDQAIRMGREVLRRKKDDGDALYLLGLAHYQRGDSAQAADLLRQFLATKPELEAAMEVEGLLQILDGNAVPMEEPEGE